MYICAQVDKGWGFLEARKESQLNSMFNVRKQKLNQITRANLVIYEKINAQVSHYGQRFHTKNEEDLAHTRSRFSTLEPRKNDRFRTILGPISHFNALSLPRPDSEQELDSEARLRCLPAKQSFKKKLKGREGEEKGLLPDLFTFY